MKDYKYAVYIGRFQPLHNGHLKIIEHGLEIAETVIVVIGSCGGAPNIRNPWTFEERRDMIDYSTSSLRGEGKSIHIVGVRDYFYNENTWITEIQSKVDAITQGSESVVLLGSYKDSSSYYLKYFPEWTLETTSVPDISGTPIRARLFDQMNLLTDWEEKAPEGFLKEHVHPLIDKLSVPREAKEFLHVWVTRKDFADRCKEWRFIQQYKRSWETAPFPPTFVTTDAVVVCSGHVLVVERKFNPGKGLFALPGGFVKESQKIQDSMLRELKEETRIAVDRIILESEIKATRVFDHPERDLRGRTITHGYYIRLKDGKLPEVRADDDAKRAFWMPLRDVAKLEDKFYGDHASIIHYFVGLD